MKSKRKSSRSLSGRKRTNKSHSSKRTGYVSRNRTSYRKRTGYRRNSGYRKRFGRRYPWFRYLILLGMVVICVIGISNCAGKRRAATIQQQGEDNRPAMDVELLTVNSYSRPGIELKKVNGIVVHYTANPGSTARQNRDYFEGLKDTHTTKASAHFVIGLDGEIVQCIPTSEMAYASNNRNSDTIAIECCHLDADGKFTQETYDSLVELTSWLCQKFGLDADDVIRHYDVTGKLCPLYFVDHEDAWKQFKKDVDAAIQAL